MQTRAARRDDGAAAGRGLRLRLPAADGDADGAAAGHSGGAGAGAGRGAGGHALRPDRRARVQPRLLRLLRRLRRLYAAPELYAGLVIRSVYRSRTL